MSKYLIQDIIPPDKKHRGALHHKAKNATEGTSARLPVVTTGTSTRGQEDRNGAYPEHKTHQVTPVTRLPISEEFLDNPRQMIVDQIEMSDTEHDANGIEKATDMPRQSVNMSVPEKKVWPYGSHAVEGPLTTTPTFRENFPQFPEYPETESGNIVSRMRAWLPWLVGVAASLIAGVLLLNFFANASVMIVPKHETLPMDEKFSAFKNGTSSDLYYATMSTTTSLSLEVPATGEKAVTAKASGKIVVYNKQTVAQRLIKNTRFQTPDGRIYRINDSITVPKTTVTGGKSAPGSLEVTVYADEAGPRYNSDPVDFTLPGLKDSPLFTKVYARSNGSIAGGASGTVKTVSDRDLKQAGEDLRVQLETKLRSKARGDLAPFQIAYDPASIVVEFGEPLLSKTPASANNKAVVA
ncbi:MAG: hypothetical protein AAB869_01415, partial [Patescibacteria group bacterium]